MLGIANGIGVPFSKSGGGGGGSFSFGTSLLLDGTNDWATQGGSSPTTTTTSFNGFNNVDWFCSVWLKSGTGGRFNNNSCVFGVRQHTGTYAQVKLQWVDTTGGSYMRVKASTINITSTYVIPTAAQTDWHHYGASIDVNVGVDVTVKFYYDGALVDTQTGTQTTVTDTDVNLTIGAARSGAEMLSGHMIQLVLGYGIPADADFTAIYGSGSGANPSDCFTGIHNIYAFSEASGTTTGDLTDTEGRDSLGMVGFVAPYGLTTDTP
tara:strand:- start:522 stop:1316 length:795 start_codon:yes stop_codon:yes gene_type:complete